MSLRILAGQRRGLKLAAPEDRSLRPTSARAREALFNRLRDRWGDPSDLAFLDVFAGTGAVGLEALSAGFDHVTFIENDPAALRLLEKNRQLMNAPHNSRVLRQDASKLGPSFRRFDVVYLDPPYGSGLIGPALNGLVRQAWLAEEAWLIVELERKGEVVPPPGLELEETRGYGAGKLGFLTNRPPPRPEVPSP
ncbi:MAG: 16S rRNA (guanine(966)-N(2))-methyltransferase RsmD [Geminicoccaceae bacterium]